MKENEKWIKAFKEKLEDYSEPIPASGWERLEKELMPVTERRIYPYRRWAVAAACRSVGGDDCCKFVFPG